MSSQVPWTPSQWLNTSILTCKCIQVQVANLMLSKSKKGRKHCTLQKVSFAFHSYFQQYDMVTSGNIIIIWEPQWGINPNTSYELFCSHSLKPSKILFSPLRCTVIVRWRKATSQNTPQTNTHSCTLIYGHHCHCQSWNINPISLHPVWIAHAQYNSSTPLLHIKRDLHSLRSN